MTPAPCPIAASASARRSSRPHIDNDTFLADTLAALERDDLRDVVLVGHSFGGLIAEPGRPTACPSASPIW